MNFKSIIYVSHFLSFVSCLQALSNIEINITMTFPYRNHIFSIICAHNICVGALGENGCICCLNEHWINFIPIKMERVMAALSSLSI